MKLNGEFVMRRACFMEQILTVRVELSRWLTSDGFLCWWRTHVLLVPMFFDDLDHDVT